MGLSSLLNFLGMKQGEFKRLTRAAVLYYFMWRLPYVLQELCQSKVESSPFQSYWTKKSGQDTLLAGPRDSRSNQARNTGGAAANIRASPYHRAQWLACLKVGTLPGAILLFAAAIFSTQTLHTACLTVNPWQIGYAVV